MNGGGPTKVPANPPAGLAEGEVDWLPGRPLKWYPVAISAGAMALAWARREAAPQGAVVVVGHELYPLDRLGRPWQVAAEQTLSCALVLRPDLPAATADVMWLAGGLIAKEAAEAVSGMTLATWWPDSTVSATSRQVVGMTKAEIQLGPGAVRSAILSIRLDLGSLGLSSADAKALLEAMLRSVDQLSGQLGGISGGESGSGDSVEGPGPANPAGPKALAERYTAGCGLIGERVRATLRPKGETRGFADRVDELAVLHVKSATGMVERVSINALRSLEVL